MIPAAVSVCRSAGAVGFEDLSAAALELIGLRKRFGDHEALAGLDLVVPAGSCYALLGPNGAGKTTTLNILLGFIQADAGTARVDGVDVQAEPARARTRIAYIPEQVQLYPRLSGFENLEYFHALGSSEAASAGLLRDCLQQAGLAEADWDRRVAGYSKGMRQKVGIAIALARRAPVMLLDEPTSGLDPQAAWELNNSLRSLAEQGVTMLMATHDLFRAREVASRIGILVNGRLQQEIDPAQVAGPELETRYLQEVRRVLGVEA
ncbi:MAG: ABC transporter ATP-binding protein [Gammaproteobacteria bacterium]|nr:ABC transporter ATP-binding protein [Gammaproteobacteria bacterium]